MHGNNDTPREGDPTSHQTAPRHGRWRWLIIISGTFLALLVIVPLVFWIGWTYRNRELLRKELADIQSSGTPLTTSEMDAWHVVPPGEPDITDVWIAALAPFGTHEFEDSGLALPLVGGKRSNTLPPLEEPLPQEVEIREYVQLHREKLAAIYNAAGQPGEVRFPRDFRHGIDVPTPEYDHARNVIRAMQLEFQLLVRDGRAEEAIHNLEARLKLGEALRHEPLPIGKLVQAGIGLANFGDTRAMANHATLSDSQLARLQQAIASIDFAETFADGFLGERATAYHAFHSLSAISSDGADVPYLETGYDLSAIWRHEDCAALLRASTEAYEVAHLPLPEMLGQGAEMEYQWRRRVEEAPLGQFRFRVTKGLAPMFGLFAKSLARVTAERDLTVVSLAAHRYRLREGRLPAKLTALAPDFLPKVPTDPFDGKSLRYRSDEGRVIVYSIGKDGVDNGGETDDNRYEPDIAVEIRFRAND